MTKELVSEKELLQRIEKGDITKATMSLKTLHRYIVSERKKSWNSALQKIEKESIKDNSIDKCPRLIISKAVLRSFKK